VLERETLALGARGLVERGAQPLGQLHRIVDGPEMQEEQPRLLIRHVTMDRRDVLQSILRMARFTLVEPIVIPSARTIVGFVPGDRELFARGR
jgi:hypothetical protein